MRPERIQELRDYAAGHYEAADESDDPRGYRYTAQIITELLDEYELLRDANAIVRVERDWWQKAASASVADESPIQINLVPNCSNAAGHTWDLDADGMECQHCGYFAPGLTTP